MKEEVVSKNPGFSVKWKMLLAQLFGVLLCTGLGFVALKQVGEEIDIAELKRRLTVPSVVVPALLYTLAWVMEGLRNWFLLKAMGEKISFWQVFLAFIGGLFVAHITPFTGGGGPIQMAYFALFGVSVARSGAMLAIGGLFAQGSLAVTIIVLLAIKGDYSLLGKSLIYFLGILVILGIVFFFGGEEKAESEAKKHQKEKKWLKALLVTMKDIPPAMRMVLKLPPSLILSTLFFTVAYHLLYMVTAPVLFQLLTGELPDFGLWLGRIGAVVLFVSLVPTPGGAGGAEALVAQIMGPLLEGHFSVGNFTLLWRTVTFHWATIIGLMGLVLMMRVAGKFSKNAAIKKEEYKLESPPVKELS